LQIAKDRKYTYEPRKKNQEESSPFNLVMKSDDSIEYHEERDVDQFLKNKASTQDFRLTNLLTGSVTDLCNSEGISKFNSINDQYTTWQTGKR
jgi:hypothetical protein